MGLVPKNPAESILPLELEEALEQRCAVVLEYLDADENRTQRVIEPIRVRRLNGELMLMAHCQLRNDRRHFKVERIVKLTRMGAPPEPVAPTLFDAVDPVGHRPGRN
jgi:predicted DNA-binding transcriptional regulator YafY